MDQGKTARILQESMNNRRGYADFFDWPDKSTKEWGIAQSFLEELERDNGPKVVCGKQHPGGENHAPDWQFTTDVGEVWGVELTELVSQKAIEATKRGKLVLASWPIDELISKFAAQIVEKDRPEKVTGGPYDCYILVVHVDEDMLPANRLKEVLEGCSFQTRLIDEIYILVSYDPGVGRLPLLHLHPIKNGLRGWHPRSQTRKNG